MVCLDSRHPDLEEFIDLKSDLDAATKCNISILADKEFIEAARNGYDYNLSYTRPETGEGIGKIVNAKEILDKIAKRNWEMGEPGLLFHDNINSNHILSEYKDIDIRCPNPCFDGDMKLLVYENGEQVYRKFSEIENTTQNVISIDGTVSKGDVFCSGEKETIKLNFLNKKSIICTPDHRFMDIDGNEVMAKDLKGKKLMPFGSYKSKIEFAPTVSSIEESGIRKVYDFQEPNNHWGCVNGVVVHNCGEVPMMEGEACLLGSFNLSEYIIEDGDGYVEFDTDNFKNDIHTVVVAMNEVQEESIERLPLEKQKIMAEQYRRIGIGIMGLADCLIKLNIRYGSNRSVKFCDNLGYIMANEALKASEGLSWCSGNFPKFEFDSIFKSKYITNNYDSHDVPDGLKNSALLSIAPTGTLSTLLGVSGGIEPIFANYYTRKTESLNSEDTYYKVYTPIVQEYMERYGYADESELPDYFVTAKDIHWRDRINVQAAWQKHVDQAISSTVNLPENTTPEEIADLYIYAHDQGLKGITVFRDNCLRTGILTTDNKEKHEPKQETILEVPDTVVGKKRKLTTGCGSLHCLAYFSQTDGRLLECYLGKGSTGGCLNSMNGIARLISLSARSGATTEEIVDQLNSTGVCPSYAVRTATKKDTSRGSCCPVAIGNALVEMHKEMLDEINNGKYANDFNKSDFSETENVNGIVIDAGNTNAIISSIIKMKKTSEAKSSEWVRDGGESMVCPECGAEMISTGGCNSCHECGYSKCG